MKVFELPMVRVDDGKYTEGRTKVMTIKEYADIGFTYTEFKESVAGVVFADISNGYRKNDNVMSLSALVFDIDKYYFDVFEQLKKDIRNTGIEAVINTTFSHDPTVKKYCYRIIIPFDNPIEKIHLEYVARKFMDLCPSLHMINKSGHLDKAFKNPCQFYYLPTCHPERKDFAVIEYLEGVPLKPNTPNNYEDEYVSSNGVDIGQDMPSQAILSTSDSISEGGRDNAITSIVGTLITQGLSKEQVLAKALILNDERCKPPLKLWEVKKSVDSIWRTEYKDKPQPTPPKDNPFGFRTYKELMQMPPIEWLISQHLTSKGVMFIYGSSQAGKTFASVDLALCLCFKSQWLGFDIKKNVPVRYCAFEDYRGVAMRVDGWAEYHGYTQEDMSDKFRLGGEGASLNITSEASVNQFIEALQLDGFKDGVIFLDTFNKICGGEEENANGKMGMAIIQAERISQATNSLVVNIHHNGKDKGKGMRGGSALHAGADLVYSIEKHSDNHSLKFEKIKNAKDGHNVGYKLETVELDKQYYNDENANTAVVIPTYTSVKKDSYEIKIDGDNNKQIYALLVKRLDAYNDYEDDYETVVKDVTAQWVEGTNKPRAREMVKRTISTLRLAEKYRGMVLDTGNRNGRTSRIWLIKNDKYHIKY